MVNRCPWCSSENVEAEFVDIGVGSEQVSPYSCGDCYSVQMNPFHEEDNKRASEEEKEIGWWKGPCVEEVLEAREEKQSMSKQIWIKEDIIWVKPKQSTLVSDEDHPTSILVVFEGVVYSGIYANGKVNLLPEDFGTISLLDCDFWAEFPEGPDNEQT